ncbi:MAG: hypothetical protein AAFQ41_04800 [Cyanobacteria bacterium J06623_7]
MSSLNSDSQNQELGQILEDVERSLIQLQSRHNQVKQDWSKRSQIQERQREIDRQKSTFKPLKTELRALQKELDDLEFTLESSLLPDVFWQVVRFVFLGIAIGWFLHLWAA